MEKMIKHYLAAVTLLILSAMPAAAQIIRDTSHFADLTAEEFSEEIVDVSLEKPEFKAPEKPTVIHLYAEWGGPCKSIQKKLEPYAKLHPEYSYCALDVWPTSKPVTEDERAERESIIKSFGGKVPTVLLGRPDGKWTYFRGDRYESELTELLDDFFSGKDISE